MSQMAKGKLSSVKPAMDALSQSMDKLPDNTKYQIRIGFVLDQVNEQSKEQINTKLRKLEQALKLFVRDEEELFGILMSVEPHNRALETLVVEAQSIMSARASLAGANSEIKKATPDQTAAVTQQTEVQKQVGQLKK